MVFLRQALQAAAHQATRRAILATATDEQVLSEAANILSARGITGFQISFPEGSPQVRERGELVTVRVVAPSAENSSIGGRFVRSRDIEVKTTMVKE